MVCYDRSAAQQCRLAYGGFRDNQVASPVQTVCLVADLALAIRGLTGWDVSTQEGVETL